MQLSQVIIDFADALKAVDSTHPIEGNFKPGIGPHKEDHARDMALKYLQNIEFKKQQYENAGSRKYPESRELCDLVIPGKWAIELKLLRPFGDNDKEAEHWSSKIIHPYYGNKSAVGDILKLKTSSFEEKKAMILLAYEHETPRIETDVVLNLFEKIIRETYNINMKDRISEMRRGLVHPTFQVLRVIGWEIC